MNKGVFLPSGTFIKKKAYKIMAAGILIWLVTIVDANAGLFIAGAFLDDKAISAITLVQPFFNIILFVGSIISTGTATLFARECGALNTEKANKYVGQGIIMSTIASALMVILVLLIKDPLIGFYGVSSEIEELIDEYYIVVILFSIIYTFQYLAYMLVTADGDETVTLAGSVAGIASDIIFSIILVQSLGIKGLAIGNITGNIVLLLVDCVHFLKKRNSVRVKFHIAYKDVINVLKVGSSAALVLLYFAVVYMLIDKVVISYFSEAYLPSLAMLWMVINFGSILCNTFDASMGFINVAFGENNPDYIRRTMTISSKAAVFQGICLFFIIEFLAPVLPACYSITDPIILADTIFGIRLIAFIYPLLGIYFLYCQYYPSVNHIALGEIMPLLYSVVSHIAVTIPLGIAIGFRGLAIGFMLSPIITEIVIVLIISFRYGVKSIPLILDKTDEESLYYNIEVKPENITALCRTVKDELEKRNADSGTVNKIQIVLEETYMTIFEKNNSDRVISECNVLISDKQIRVILRDNGTVFDPTDSDSKISSFRGYVVPLFIGTTSKYTHMNTVSFNRNCFIWNRNN